LKSGILRTYPKPKQRRPIPTAPVEEFKIPMNAPLVLGCGTIDGRKGTDLFIQVAYRVLADFGKDSQKTDQKLESPHFIWLGAG